MQGKGGEGRQTDSESEGDRKGERERERDTQSPWEREVLGEQPVLFKSTVTHLSQSWWNVQLSSFFHTSEFNAERLRSVRRGKQGMWVMSLVSP